MSTTQCWFRSLASCFAVALLALGCSSGEPESGKTCARSTDSCSQAGSCSTGQANFEYAPGCCGCRPATCESVQCAEAPSCPSHTFLELGAGSCCPVCFSDKAFCPGQAPCADLTCPPGTQATGADPCCTCEP
ncbi:MAG: hypothetical protein KF718_01085 [Polyangiaceae bacterium]|nr:hypothetical protein [Polyangiaceae bacterium]